MKRIISLMVILAILLFGCNKSELDLFPYNQVETSQAFNTEEDVQLAINGMYEGFKTGGNPVFNPGATAYLMGFWNIVPDVLADNLILMQTGRQSLRTYGEWRYVGDASEVFQTFRVSYLIIRRANAILENIERFGEGAFKDNAKGEALAIRGMVHFDLARVYSETYLNASASDLTVPYVSSTEATLLPPHEPLLPFYDKVIADLTQAVSLINENNGVGRLKKSAVYGLLSRVYLYKGDYAAAIAAADAALGAVPPLAGIGTFPLIWTDQTEQEVLFKLKNTLLDNRNDLGVNYSQTVAAGIRSEYVVEYNFFQLFQDNDVRKSTYIQTSPYNNIVYNHVIKYAGRPGQPAGVLDGKVIRVAEVLLNRAESYFRTGNESAALADLILLKSNRYTGYVQENISGQALLEEILLQRRLELAFEGDRFFDLKRRNLPIMRDGTKGDRADGTGTPYVFTNMAIGDHRFLLPIPVSELNFNPNISQNPGY